MGYNFSPPVQGVNTLHTYFTEAYPMNPVKKHLIALINYVALVPLVYFIPDWVAPYLPANKLVQVCAVVAIIVPIISYIVMPLAIKRLAKTK